MDKKDLITNINIAYQGSETRRAIETSTERITAEISKQTEVVESARQAAENETEHQRLSGIIPDDMLPIERMFRTARFDDDIDD